MLKGKKLFTLICITLIAENYVTKATSINSKSKCIRQLESYIMTFISIWIIIEFALRNSAVDFIYFQF